VTFWLPPSDEAISQLPIEEFKENYAKKRKKKDKEPQQNQTISLELAEIKDGYLRSCVMFENYDQTVFIASLTLMNLFIGEIWGCISGNHVNDISIAIGFITLLYYW
jgi:hypothetical protein